MRALLKPLPAPEPVPCHLLHPLPIFRFSVDREPINTRKWTAKELYSGDGGCLGHVGRTLARADIPSLGKVVKNPIQRT